MPAIQVGVHSCPCEVTQPPPHRYPVGAVFYCPHCGQAWERRSHTSSRRSGGGIVIRGVLVGGIGRAADVPYWARLGRNVARDAAMSRARVAYEQAYMADAAELRAAVEAGSVPAGVSVRAYREHRDATESPALRLFGGSVAVLCALCATGWGVLWLAGTHTGAWHGVAVLGVLWTAACIGAVSRGVARRREASSAVLSRLKP